MNYVYPKAPSQWIPELLWKVYIDFEIEEGERDTRCGLYEQLIALSRHVKVWISYVLFEAEPIPVPRAERGRERRKVKMMLSPRPFPCETGI
jgi:hypothetical protein